MHLVGKIYVVTTPDKRHDPEIYDCIEEDIEKQRDEVEEATEVESLLLRLI